LSFERRAAVGATYAFSRSPLSRASRAFIDPVLTGRKGSIWPVRPDDAERTEQIAGERWKALQSNCRRATARFRPEQTFPFTFRSRGHAPATFGIGAKVLGHARHVAFQVAAVEIRIPLFAELEASASRINWAERDKRDALDSNSSETCAMTALDWTEFIARRPHPGISQRLPTENVCPLLNAWWP
jgi:hypothetical protein